MKASQWLHAVEIIAIVLIGAFQISVMRRQNALYETLNAQPKFEISFQAGALGRWGTPHVRRFPQSGRIQHDAANILTLRNRGPVNATGVHVKATVRFGADTRFAAVAVRNEVTGEFIPQDDWKLHYIDENTYQYLNIAIRKLTPGGWVSIFFAFASSESRVGKYPDALAVEVAADQKLAGEEPKQTFPIWFSPP